MALIQLSQGLNAQSVDGFNQGDAHDLILDFDVWRDMIDLSGFGFDGFDKNKAPQPSAG